MLQLRPALHPKAASAVESPVGAPGWPGRTRRWTTRGAQGVASLLALVEPTELTVDLCDHRIEGEQPCQVIAVGSGLQARVGLQRFGGRRTLCIDDLVEVDSTAVDRALTIERRGDRELDDQFVAVGGGPESGRGEPLTDFGAAGSEIARAVAETFRERKIAAPVPQREIRMLG